MQHVYISSECSNIYFMAFTYSCCRWITFNLVDVFVFSYNWIYVNGNTKAPTILSILEIAFQLAYLSHYLPDELLDSLQFKGRETCGSWKSQHKMFIQSILWIISVQVIKSHKITYCERVQTLSLNHR